MTQLVAAIENVRTSSAAASIRPTDQPRRHHPIPEGGLPRCPPRTIPRQLEPTTGTIFNPTTALVFWLGGAQDTSGHVHRFQRQSAKPVRCQRRPLPPDLRFREGRQSNPQLRAGAAPSTGGGGGSDLEPVPVFPQNGQPTASAPYLYFKAVGGVYTTTAVTSPRGGPIATLPYADSTTARSASSTPRVINSSAPDWTASTVVHGNSAPLYPAGSNYDPPTGGTT